MLEIDYGSPGIIGILLIVCAGVAAVIVLSIFLRAAKEAHDEVVDEIHERGGDLDG